MGLLPPHMAKVMWRWQQPSPCTGAAGNAHRQCLGSTAAFPRGQAGGRAQICVLWCAWELGGMGGNA